MRIIPYFILFLPFFGIGQSNSSIDILGGLDYSYRYLRSSSDENAMKFIIAMLDSLEIGNPGWRGGFNYNRRITENIHLKTGLRFASNGYKTIKMLTQWSWPEEQEPGFPEELQFFDNYWFLEIPIALRMELGDRKLSPYIEFGLSPHIYLATRQKIITNIKSETKFLKDPYWVYRKLHLVGFVSIGSNYTVSERLVLFAQPAFRFHLTSLTDTPIKTHLYNFGIEAGVRRLLFGKSD